MPCTPTTSDASAGEVMPISGRVSSGDNFVKSRIVLTPELSVGLNGIFACLACANAHGIRHIKDKNFAITNFVAVRC